MTRDAVDKELDAFIERRSRGEKRKEQDVLKEMWAASERRERERRRRKNGAPWYEFHMRLSDAHARLSAEHEESALALLEDERAEAAHDRHKSGTREARKRPSQGGTTT